MIQVVAFHVTPSREATDRIAGSCATFHHDNDYLALLRILFRSAELHNAAVEKFILTDAPSSLSSLAGLARVVRSPCDPDQVMFSRLCAQIEFLERHGDDGHVVFLDADMIINAPLEPLFAEDFDIALTYREDREMPINGGIILVKRGRAPAASAFLRRVADTYAAKFASQSHWWGDQRALIDVLGVERFESRTSDFISIEGVGVRLLPCARYNFSPDNRAKAITAPLVDKVILHFKGERKRLMPLYWDAYLATRYQLGLGALWQAQRARWRLRFAAWFFNR